MTELTIFHKIISGEIPCKKVYEDEHTFAFHDISPQAPVHVLVVPKTAISSLQDASELSSEILGKLLVTCNIVAEKTGIKDTGYRVVTNAGSQAGQTVNYLHFHVLGGRNLSWPPG